MPFEFKMPDIGEGVVDGEIVRWFIQAGDLINEDQPMVEVMTDKATVEIPSPRKGKILAITGKEGEIVKVGQTLVVIETDGDARLEATLQHTQEQTQQQTQDARQENPKAPAQVVEAQPGAGGAGTDLRPVNGEATPAEADPNSRVLATPATRKLARELGVDLQRVPPGAKGRVNKEDLQRFVDGAPTAGAGAQPAKLEPGEREERVPLRGLRKRIAEKMVQSKHVAPHYTYVEEADFTDLSILREKIAERVAAGGVKMTYLPLIIKATVAALKKYPLVNASLDDARQEIVLRRYYNIGIGVATEQGLNVPIIRDADRLSVVEIARELERISREAREGKTRLEDLRGGTFTITSLGPLGGLMATPIINYPEVAILGVHKIGPRPVVRNGQIVIREMGNLSVSLDHRVVDGAIGAQFLQELIAHVETPGLLFLNL
ncbi:MAG: dihydrolipoamide acetyltransferase family protein [Acidobacteriota bacterium]